MTTAICSNTDCNTRFFIKPGSTGKYCSQSCAATVNNRKYPKRSPEFHCRDCKDPISGRMSRKHDRCSDCAGTSPQAKRRIYIEKWLSGEIRGGSDLGLSTVIRRHLIEINDSACSLCGFSTPHPDDGSSILEVDHINGDGTDHRPDNVRVVCPNCHALTSTYRGRNQGNGRPVKYNRVPI